jgi:hypothetical protein
MRKYFAPVRRGAQIRQAFALRRVQELEHDEGDGLDAAVLESDQYSVSAQREHRTVPGISVHVLSVHWHR